MTKQWYSFLTKTIVQKQPCSNHPLFIAVTTAKKDTEGAPKAHKSQLFFPRAQHQSPFNTFGLSCKRRVNHRNPNIFSGITVEVLKLITTLSKGVTILIAIFSHSQHQIFLRFFFSFWSILTSRSNYHGTTNLARSINQVLEEVQGFLHLKDYFFHEKVTFDVQIF